jgi:hypothetical protein
LWEELEDDDPNDAMVLRAGLRLVRARMQTVSDRLYAERRLPLIG